MRRWQRRAEENSPASCCLPQLDTPDDCRKHSRCSCKVTPLIYQNTSSFESASLAGRDGRHLNTGTVLPASRKNRKCYRIYTFPRPLDTHNYLPDTVVNIPLLPVEQISSYGPTLEIVTMTRSAVALTFSGRYISSEGRFCACPYRGLCI